MRKLMVCLIALVFAASACGANPTQERIANAPAVAREAGTAKLLINITSKQGSGKDAKTVGAKADGVSDFDNERARVVYTFTIPPGLEGAKPGKHSCTVVIDGKTVYVSVPKALRKDFENRAWVSIEAQDQSAIAGFAASDPAAPLVYLAGIGPDVEEIGNEEIAGEPAVHYRGKIVSDLLLEKAPEENREALRQQFEAQNVESLPVNVWLDEEQRPVKMTLDLVQGGATQNLNMQLSDYGAEADIKVPAAKSVLSGQSQQEAARICLPQP